MTGFLEKIENILVQNSGNDYQFHWSIAADMCDEAGEKYLADAIRSFLADPKTISVEHQMEDYYNHAGIIYKCQGISSETIVGLVNSVYLAERFGTKLHSRPFVRME